MGLTKWLLVLLGSALALAAGRYCSGDRNATFESLNRMAIGAVSESEIAREVFHIRSGEEGEEGEAVLVSGFSASPASGGYDDGIFDIIRYRPDYPERE